MDIVMQVAAVVASVITIAVVYDRAGTFAAPYPTFRGPVLSTLAIATLYVVNLTVLGPVVAALIAAVAIAAMVNLPVELYSLLSDPPTTMAAGKGRRQRREHQGTIAWAAEHADELDAQDEWIKNGCVGPNPLEVLDRKPSNAETQSA